MKTKVFILICLMISSMVFGQNETPKFAGDSDLAANLNADNSVLINNYIVENLVCPKQAADCCKEGTEIVQFTVTESGNVSDFKVINSVCSELDKEVIRVLKTTKGMWIPGVKNGEPVAYTKEVTFMFGDHSSESIENYFTKTGTRNFKKGSTNLFVKNNPENALRNFNTGINYLPNDKALLTLRGLCHYELGDKESAEKTGTEL